MLKVLRLLYDSSKTHGDGSFVVLRHGWFLKNPLGWVHSKGDGEVSSLIGVDRLMLMQLLLGDAIGLLFPGYALELLHLLRGVLLESDSILCIEFGLFLARNGQLLVVCVTARCGVGKLLPC